MLRVDSEALRRRQLIDATIDAIADVGFARASLGQIARRAAQVRPGHIWPGSEMGLTQRESELLRTMVDGLNNRAIAEALVISEDTVKTHVRAIFRKLGVTDRARAVSVALREGIFR